MNAKIFLAMACAVIPALSSCGSTSGAIERSKEYYEHANYYQAFMEIAEARNDNPGDPELERAYQAARKAWLMEEAQEHIFRDREREAMANLQQILTLAPDNAIAQRWMEKARQKLARRTVEDGDRERAQGNLDQALILYSEAMTYVPDFPPAKEGVGLVRDSWAKRRAKANDRYLMGVRALAEQLFGQTWYQMGIAIENDPGLKQAQRGQQAAQRRIIEERYEIAKLMEQDGFYAAALREYIACKKRQTDLDGIDERISAMQRETKAEDLMLAAEHKMSRGDYDEARRLFDKAWETTVLQRAMISELLVVLTDRILEEKYTKARDFEYQNQKEKALAAFQEIDEAAPEGYEDVKARISSLESDLDVAGKAVMRGLEAEKAGDWVEALDAYSEAVLVYPGFQQLDAKVAELMKKVAAMPKEVPAKEPEAGTDQEPPDEKPPDEKPADQKPAGQGAATKEEAGDSPVRDSELTEEKEAADAKLEEAPAKQGSEKGEPQENEAEKPDPAKKGPESGAPSKGAEQSGPLEGEGGKQGGGEKTESQPSKDSPKSPPKQNGG